MMTITSGFGITFDIERGTLRHWTMRDGVRGEEEPECHTKK